MDSSELSEDDLMNLAIALSLNEDSSSQVQLLLFVYKKIPYHAYYSTVDLKPGKEINLKMYDEMIIVCGQF